MGLSFEDRCIQGFQEGVELIDSPVIVTNEAYEIVFENSKFTLPLRLILESFFVTGLVSLVSSAGSSRLEDFCCYFSSPSKVSIPSDVFSITFTRSAACNLKLWIVKFNLVRSTERREVMQKQIHSARMIAMAEMSSGIAHEINNPLTVVLSKANLIERILSVDPHYKQTQLLDSIKKINHHSVRISKIIRSLRSLSRNDDSSEMTLVNLVDVLEEASSLSGERFKARGVRFNLNLRGLSKVIIRGREFQISQVIINLLNNAFDAVQGQPISSIDLSLSVNSGLALVQVADSGAGVPPLLREKIMLPFFTTKKEGHGTGIGLSISSSIIEAHGGTLRLNPAISDSCFEFSLPLANETLIHGTK